MPFPTRRVPADAQVPWAGLLDYLSAGPRVSSTRVSCRPPRRGFAGPVPSQGRGTAALGALAPFAAQPLRPFPSPDGAVPARSRRPPRLSPRAPCRWGPRIPPGLRGEGKGPEAGPGVGIAGLLRGDLTPRPALLPTFRLPPPARCQPPHLLGAASPAAAGPALPSRRHSTVRSRAWHHHRGSFA